MALSNTNNYIQTLVSAGSDAQSNLYIVNFVGGSLTDSGEALTVRCQGFQPPQTFSQNSYQNRFITAFIEMPASKVNVSRNFSLTFRVDAYYDIYKKLLEQRGVTSDPANSYVANDILTLKNNNMLFDVEVAVVDDGVHDAETISSQTIFKFKDCWISSVGAIQYTTDSANAATTTVGINFLEMEDLQSGITNITSTPNVAVGFYTNSESLGE